jgi:Tfp pilus assembly protein PilN
MIERIEINLLPATYRVHRKTIKLKRAVVYPLLGVLVTGVVLLIIMLNFDAQIGQLKAGIFTTEQSIEKNKPIKEEIVKLKANKLVVQEKILALERINVDRAKWVRIMELLCQRLPDFTWLLSCDEKDASLLIEGRTYSFPEVANLMTRLSESNYIRSVDLSGIEEKDASKTFSFIVTCKLNPYGAFENVAVSDSATAAKKKSEVR